MSVPSENNVQSATNCAFPLKREKGRENCERKKEIANTLVHHAVILYELSVHRALLRYIPSSIISLKLVK